MESWNSVCDSRNDHCRGWRNVQCSNSYYAVKVHACIITPKDGFGELHLNSLLQGKCVSSGHVRGKLRLTDQKHRIYVDLYNQTYNSAKKIGRYAF